MKTKLRLKPDASLTLGRSPDQPVDLVSKSLPFRVSLSGDEATVSMMLAENAAPPAALLDQMRDHGLDWNEQELESFLARLDDAGALEKAEEAPSDWLEDATAADESQSDQMGEEKATSIYQRPGLQPPLTDVPTAAPLREVPTAPVPLEDMAPDPTVAGPEEPTAAGPPLAVAPVAAPPLTPQLTVAGPEAAAAEVIAIEPDQPSTGRQGLAQAARLVCSGRHEEAAELLAPILAREPDNLQALAMLELIKAAELRRPAERRRRRSILLAAAALFLVLLLAILGLLVRVPREVSQSCSGSFIAIDAVRAPIGGRLQEAPRSSRAVGAGESVAVIHDLEGARRLEELKADLASDRELQSIMRTEGTDEDERRLKTLLLRLQGELGACRQASCAEADRLTRRLERTREKLRFCEWKPLPAEREAVDGRVQKLEAEVADLSAQLRVTVVSPRSGLVVEPRRAGGPVKRGEILARLVEPHRFLVSSRFPSQTVPAGAPARVTFSGQGFTQAFTGRVAGPVRAGERFTVVIDADAAKAQIADSCRMAVVVGRRSLASWLVDRGRR